MLRNGSGNLIAECYGFDGNGAALEIWVASGDYEGPGNYPMINDTSRGHLILTPEDGTAYSNLSQNPLVGCGLTITVAQDSNYPDRGTRVAGVFSCTGLVDQIGDPPASPIDVQNGAFDLDVI